MKAFNSTSDVERGSVKVSSKQHPYGFLKCPEMEAQELSEHNFLSVKGLLGVTLHEEAI